MTKTKTPASTPTTYRQPTQAERDAIAAAKSRQAERQTRVEVKQHGASGGTLTVGHPHADGSGWNAQLTDAFGTSSMAFAGQAMARLATAGKANQAAAPTEEQTNAALALMGAIAPRDELEAAIGEQIIATHLASLDLLARARLNAGEYVGSAAAYTTMATKVSRTMATHVEALAKLRSGGKQTHEVRYVYVNGPAVFGDHAQTVIGGTGALAGGGENTKPGQSLAQINDGSSRLPEMWSQDPGRDALPVPRGEGSAAMSDARRQGWSPNGEGERPLQDRAVDPGVARRPKAGAAGSSDRGAV